MSSGLLRYDGGAYALESDVIRELLDRGVIDAESASGEFSLAPEHLIDEVEPVATVLGHLTSSVARGEGSPERQNGPRLIAPNGFGGRR